MENLETFYKEDDQVYYCDTCTPLVEAWEIGELKFQAWARLTYPGTYRLDGKDILPGLSSIGYWDACTDQNWGLDWHRNEGIEISFLETGSMNFAMGEQEYLITPNELFIARPWQPHKLGNPNIGIGKLHWIIIDVKVRYPHQQWKWPSWIMLNQDDLEELTTILRHNELPVWKTNDEIKKCFQKIGNLLSSPDALKNESWIMIYVNELLMHCLDFFRKGAIQLDKTLTEGYRSIAYFIEEVNTSYFELWTLESMAEYCGLGTTRFTYYCKQLVNMTPMQYLNSVRMKNAARLLLERPTESIAQICYDCGYSSGQYFSTTFRKHFGCSPAAYRQQIIDTD